MKFLREALVCCLVGLISLTLLACGGKTQETSDGQTTTQTPVTMATIQRNDLASLLSAQEISDTLGVTMNEPTVSGQGTSLTSIATEGQTVLNVEMEERPRDIFEQALQEYGDLVPCPNLGDTAWYSPLYSQLMVYGKGYMMLVEITGLAESDAEITMLRARQIAALLLQRMPEPSGN